MVNPTTVEVDPLYYLHNFNQLLNTIEELHLDLLHDDDRQLLASYQQLSQPAQQLYIRLICRRAMHFRHDKLNYPEIQSLEQAANELDRQNLLVINPTLSAHELGNLMTAQELKLALQQKGSWRKAELTEILDSRLEDQPADATQWQTLLPEHVYQPLGRESIERFRLIYFGNLYQDLSQFVVTDLGLMQFEPYPLDRETRAFNTPAALDRYLHLQRINEFLEEGGLPTKDMLTVMSATTNCQRLEHKRNRLIKAAGQLLERSGELKSAITLYQSATLPPNRERYVRTLFKAELYTEALHACESLAAQPLNTEEEAFCESFAPRIKRKLGGPPVSKKNTNFQSEQLSLTDTGNRVEEQVITHYQSLGFEGVWCENELFNALFGLLFWRQIFTPLPGAFSHPYQQAPLDFNSPDFAKRREEIFNARLNALENLDLYDEAIRQVAKSDGLANPFINWKRFNPHHLATLCERIPANLLLQILRRICFDHQAYRSGFPDLFVWHPHTSDYLLVEVKGPGDQLQNSQKRWLKVFEEIGIHYRISWVLRPA
ncbi:VRR-NUC domain-containing protein [Pontibacterium granulatum]|uniref:VRR-NUC domain-containing protein n=1 Tax=Pontibacterium granulatum TaxID=2036029 RepID=UPI00249AA8DF|nr:VRR-NUC domain-containing protein [Pontibacterium granulatum]MDI3324450.1 VRR-NUC domain-containing protein [Pontibacterium granulatum]